MLRSACVPLTSPLTYRLSLSYQDDRPGCPSCLPLKSGTDKQCVCVFYCFILSRRSRQREQYHASCLSICSSVFCMSVAKSETRFSQKLSNLEPLATLQDAATGEFNGMSSHSHVSHCRVLPLGEFTVMISEPHAALQGAVTWRSQCHDRATLQGVRIPSTILKIVFRHILFLLFS